MTLNPAFELFKKEFPEVRGIFSTLDQSIGKDALDEKRRQKITAPGIKK
ncbi:hypothetical protein [Neobacillus niacini]|nr:hypothetical protein [Neobacillus niacini]MCM3766329.1 hypothetical protein [Neobacillus niacini]